MVFVILDVSLKHFWYINLVFNYITKHIQFDCCTFFDGINEWGLFYSKGVPNSFLTLKGKSVKKSRKNLSNQVFVVKIDNLVKVEHVISFLFSCIIVCKMSYYVLILTFSIYLFLCTFSLASIFILYIE